MTDIPVPIIEISAVMGNNNSAFRGADRRVHGDGDRDTIRHQPPSAVIAGSSEVDRNELIKVERLLHQNLCTYKEARWEEIFRQTNLPWPNARTLRREFQDQACYKSSWTRNYRPVQILQTLRNADPATASSFLQQTLRDTCNLHVYWRSLDRFPHDTADLFTIRYNFCLYPAPVDLSQGESTSSVAVDAWCFCNNDRQQYLAGPWKPRSVNLNNMPSLHETISDRILQVVNRLQDDGPRLDSTYNVVDTSRDAYDTEWCSVEAILYTKIWRRDTHQAFPQNFRERVRIFLLCNQRMNQDTKLPPDVMDIVIGYLAGMEAPPGVGVPVFRVHRQCLSGRQWDGQDSAVAAQPYSEGTKEQVDLFSFLSNVVGMERPIHWTGAEWMGMNRCLASSDLAQQILEEQQQERQRQRDIAAPTAVYSAKPTEVGEGYYMPTMLYF